MARRATSLTKERNTTQTTAPADQTEQATAKATRRGRKPKLGDMPPADMSVADAFFPGGEEPTASAAGGGSNEPAKAGRVRRSRAIELAAETLTDADGAQELTAPTAPVNDAKEIQEPNTVAAPDAQPSTSMASADAQSTSPAARWDGSTGTASFDWPVIEAVAASAGPNQVMAKLLLAARAEGANSRWPF